MSEPADQNVPGSPQPDANEEIEVAQEETVEENNNENEIQETDSAENAETADEPAAIAADVEESQAEEQPADEDEKQEDAPSSGIDGAVADDENKNAADGEAADEAVADESAIPDSADIATDEGADSGAAAADSADADAEAAAAAPSSEQPGEQAGAAEDAKADDSESAQAAPENTDGSEAAAAAAGDGTSTPRRISPRDNEGEGGDEEQQLQMDQREKQPAIPDDFYYDVEEFVSRPRVSADSGLPANLVELCFSFGYDCKKRDNLHLLDKDNVCFVAGNLVKILNLNTKEQKYLRSSSGGAIGAVAVHPSRQFIAVAEKGSAPNVLVYEYPTLRLHRILRGGTERAYAYCKFNKEGTYLATVGSDPDFMLTIWDWKSEQTVLRSKAFSQDVYRVSWSQDLEGFLTTAGAGHVRFWKMASTFTGLKLQGAIGKFGKTEISDIEGFVELPDGKVLSGCEWGNMLVWDGGLIKVEIGKKGKRPAHGGPIYQVVMDAGELMTVGIDGLIQTWDFEMIDTAEAVDESGLVEMEPMNSYDVGNSIQLAHIEKQLGSEGEDGSADWLAQDGNGGIWRLDLSFSHTAQPPERLLSSHAGAINGCSVSPLSHLAATIGDDGSVRVLDFVARRQLAESRFNREGTKILWAPPSLDPKGHTILCGFSDGVLRVLSFGENPETDPTRRAKQMAELALVAALKPHSGRLVDVAVDPAGDVLVTAGIEHSSNHEEDTSSSIFFFSAAGSKYTPIGFIPFSGRAVQVSWLPAEADGQDAVRVFLADGRVCDFDCPDPAKTDASVTYELQGYSMRQRFSFASVKSKLRRAEELEEIHRKEAEELKRRVEERKRKLERGLQTEEEQVKEVEEEEKEIAKRRAEEQEWEPYIPEERSPIEFGLVCGQNSFWLSMGSYDAGYLYQCEYPTIEASADDAGGADSFDVAQREPVRSVPVKESGDVAVSSLVFSSSGNRAYLGMADGTVRVQLLAEPFDIGSMTSQWSLAMHDNDYGAVTGLCASYDDAFLISVGRDGNYFVYNLMPEEQQERAIQEAAKAKLPSARKPGQKLADDIDDPAAYSIEEDKQKSEHDRKVKLAEEKKAAVRRRVNELRVEFRRLKEQNQALPERIQLRNREFEMVPQLKLDQQQQRQEKIQMVEREMAWEAERCQIALNKLRRRFLDDLECELIVVKAVSSDHEVTSIRTSKLSEAFQRLKAEMERKRTLASLREATRDPTQQANTEIQSEATMAKEDEQPLLKANLRGARGERIKRQLMKVEEKKRRRAQRRQEWEKQHSLKPSDDYDDPKDVSDIQEARNNMGDFKLKSASDYVVPPHLRLSSDKARQKLLDLDENVYDYRCHFNNRLLALRNKKKQLVQLVNEKLDHLQLLHSRMQPEQRKLLPPRLQMHPEEWPERKYEYTQETLLDFKAEMEAKAAAAATGEDQTGFAAMKKAAGIQSQSTVAGQHTAHNSQLMGTGAASSSSATAAESTSADSHGASSQLSQLQQQRRAVSELRDAYEQDRLLRDIEAAVHHFDCELRLLRHEKFDLDAKLKRAELRQITLFEEYQLLKDFEMAEGELANRVESRGEERVDVQNRIVECSNKIEAKRKDIERVQEKDKQLFDRFKESLGEGHKFADYLTKVYRKRIKRRRTEKQGDDADEETESESESDDDFESEEEESDGEGARYDLDICPAGCDQNLYDSTCALREERLVLEEELAEERKVMEALRKELESLQKKFKMVETALAQAERELEAFQLEKQSKLNELETIVVLRLHQMLHHENGQLPQEISKCLVFERSSLLRLKRRINELHDEKQQQAKQQREAKRRNIQLNKDRRLYQQHIDDMKVKSEKMMVDKFGKVEDMERLEQIVINPKIEELTVKMSEQQELMLQEMNEWDDKIREAKDRLIDQTRDNTKRLSQMLMLYNEQVDLEIQIQSRQKNLGSEYQGAREADIEEIEKLMQLVQIQAQELNALKEEIGLLSRKGGHILPPVQPPMQGGGGL